jgi:hypothetical protein
MTKRLLTYIGTYLVIGIAFFVIITHVQPGTSTLLHHGEVLIMLACVHIMHLLTEKLVDVFREQKQKRDRREHPRYIDKDKTEVIITVLADSSDRTARARLDDFNEHGIGIVTEEGSSLWDGRYAMVEMHGKRHLFRIVNADREHNRLGLQAVPLAKKQ